MSLWLRISEYNTRLLAVFFFSHYIFSIAVVYAVTVAILLFGVDS